MVYFNQFVCNHCFELIRLQKLQLLVVGLHNENEVVTLQILPKFSKVSPKDECNFMGKKTEEKPLAYKKMCLKNKSFVLPHSFILEKWAKRSVRPAGPNYFYRIFSTKSFPLPSLIVFTIQKLWASETRKNNPKFTKFKFGRKIICTHILTVLIMWINPREVALYNHFELITYITFSYREISNNFYHYGCVMLLCQVSYSLIFRFMFVYVLLIRIYQPIFLSSYFISQRFFV